MDTGKATENAGTHIEVMDGLRGIAIIMVLTFHAWQLSWFDHTIRLFNLRIDLNFIPKTGFLGVELFFFISAFCLFYPYARYLFEGRKLQTLKQFMYRRAIKILPSYVLSIIIIMVFLNPGFSSFKGTVWQVVTHLLFIHNLFPETYGAINGVFWSLGVEVQFYVLFPLICLLFRKKPLLVFSVMVAASILYRSYIRLNFPGRLDILLNQLPGFLDMFAFGMLTAYIIVYIRARFIECKRLAPFFTVFAAIMFMLMLYMFKWLDNVQSRADGLTLLKIWQADNRTYIALIFMLLAVSSSFSLGIWKLLIANRLFTFMSVISYNLYIWHQLIARILFENKIPVPATADPHADHLWMASFTLISIFSSISISALITYAFERPLLKKGVKGCTHAILAKIRQYNRKKGIIDMSD